MSKKLEGNGLWESSRMMLPQHKEQSMPIQSDKPPTTPEPPTKKEFQMMRDSIILAVALSIIEKKSIEVEASSQTLRLLYAAAAKILAKCVREDVQKSKKTLIEGHIRMFEDMKDDTVITYRFVCRGYEDCFTISKDFIRAEVSMKLGTYVKSLIALLQDTIRDKQPIHRQ